LALVWTAIAAILVAVALGACGSSDNDSSTSDTGGSAATGASTTAAGPSLKGQKITFWIMNIGPNPVADTKKILKPFEE
jgi:ABC-type glycerol-3-phosphate transport system substrate-binding protein